MIFFAVGFVGGGSAVGIAWIVWWHFESRRPIWPPPHDVVGPDPGRGDDRDHTPDGAGHHGDRVAASAGAPGLPT
jgi:hypothetical protein